jgi:hypothetical protein
MRCSFIVSAFHQPEHLHCLLYSLKVQTEPSFEVLVMDNATDPAMQERNREAFPPQDARFRHVPCGLRNCYESANYGATIAQGEYLNFPSCDNYYVPQFLQRMLIPGVDFTYCDMVYDPRHCNGTTYTVVRVEPRRGLIDKGGFLVRRKRFEPFPWEQDMVLADGLLAERLTARYTSMHVPGVLWVHN